MSYSDDFLNNPDNASVKQWALQQMRGEGIPTADSLYSGAKAGIDANAFNYAGSQASQMASRGMSGSGYDRQAMANAAGQHGSQLADAKKSAAEKVMGLKNDAFAQGTDALNDYNARADEANKSDIARQTQIDNLNQQQANDSNVWNVIGKWFS